MHHINIAQILSGAAAYGVLAYAARTIPVPDNPWAKWVVGVLQFALSNVEKGQAMMANEPKPPESGAQP